jgi:HK97 gp10 family phage protein
MGTRFRWEPDRDENIMRHVLADALEPVSLEVLADATRLVPVDTGALRESLDREVDGAALVARIGSNLNYAGYVEYGTEKMDAEPYLRPALYRKRAL